MWICLLIVEIPEHSGGEELVCEFEGVDEWPEFIDDVGDGLVVF